MSQRVFSQWHSNRTIFSPLRQSCPENFPHFSLSYWGANSYYPRGPIMGKENSHNPRKEWESGFSVLGAFKLDHLHPFKPLLFWKISNFFTFVLGGQFLLPQRANKGKRGFSQLQKRMRQWVYGALGLHAGPFAALCTPHFLKNFKLFHFRTGRPILITQESQ